MGLLTSPSIIVSHLGWRLECPCFFFLGGGLRFGGTMNWGFGIWFKKRKLTQANHGKPCECKRLMRYLHYTIICGDCLPGLGVAGWKKGSCKWKIEIEKNLCISWIYLCILINRCISFTLLNCWSLQPQVVFHFVFRLISLSLWGLGRCHCSALGHQGRPCWSVPLFDGSKGWSPRSFRLWNLGERKCHHGHAQISPCFRI